MATRLRKYWLLTHRWLGLTAGLVFSLVGLTGSLLVFDHAIDEWLNPELLLTTAQGTRAPLVEVIESAEDAYGGASLAVSKPRVANGVWTVWFSTGDRATPQLTAVYVDPFTAAVTGQRVWGQDVMSWIYRLHFRLLAGETGGDVVGIIGLLLIFSLVSGIILWWPLWKKSWRVALAVRSGKLWFDLHKTVGTVSAVVLIVVAFTGIYMEFPATFQAAVARFADVYEHPEGLTSARSNEKSPLTPDAAIGIAEALFPKAKFDHLHPPQGAAGTYEVAVRQPGELQRSFGRTQVFLDQYSGEVLAVHDPRECSPADAFFAAQFPLHNGEVLGLIGRWLVFLTGLTPAVLYATGFALWWRRQRQRSRQFRRKRQRVT